MISVTELFHSTEKLLSFNIYGKSEDKVKGGKAMNSSAEMWGTRGKHMHKTDQEKAFVYEKKEKSE